MSMTKLFIIFNFNFVLFNFTIRILLILFIINTILNTILNTTIIILFNLNTTIINTTLIIIKYYLKNSLLIYQFIFHLLKFISYFQYFH